jgi:putative transposase
MARLARVVVPCLPHSRTQHGSDRACPFFSGTDYALYRELLAMVRSEIGIVRRVGNCVRRYA